tara:strand:+ start:181 stop:867 length:687 start_codon:yes stop_codon:yes gene_type:complete
VKNIYLIIFARLNSKRLKKKVFRKIFDNYLLEIVYLRIKKKLKYKIIINTSDKKTDDPIVKFCMMKKIKFFRGDLNNVFLRTIKCIKKYNISAFVRVNADRPFVDFDQIKKAIEIFKSNKYDIVTNQLNKKSPKGLSCEVARSKIFKEVLGDKKLKKSEKEHIFNYFYQNKKKYKIYQLKNKLYEKNSKLNFSIDNKKDLIRTTKIFSKFKKDIFIPTSKVIKISKAL